MPVMTEVERIAALEVKVDQINEDQKEIKQKLDELLVLRHKGMGAFWLAASLLGSGIVGTILALKDWFFH